MNHSLVTQKNCNHYSESLQTSKQQRLLRYTEETLELWYAEQRCTYEVLIHFSKNALQEHLSTEFDEIRKRYATCKSNLMQEGKFQDQM